MAKYHDLTEEVKQLRMRARTPRQVRQSLVTRLRRAQSEAEKLDSNVQKTITHIAELQESLRNAQQQLEAQQAKHQQKKDLADTLRRELEALDRPAPDTQSAPTTTCPPPSAMGMVARITEEGITLSVPAGTRAQHPGTHERLATTIQEALAQLDPTRIPDRSDTGEAPQVPNSPRFPVFQSEDPNATPIHPAELSEQECDDMLLAQGTEIPEGAGMAEKRQILREILDTDESDSKRRRPAP